MEFDFLTKLPNSNLDDRTFQDLVEECLLRIPRYCPEWTNYNPSDPGVTLIELFAWLTDQMLLRFNQVPRRNYVAFLELLGIRLLPPAPAIADITMYLSAALPNTYVIPPGVELATLRTETEPAIVFSTLQPLVVGKPNIRHFLTAQEIEDEPLILRDRFSNLWTRRPDGEWSGRELNIFDEQPQPGNCFYLVFEPECECEGNVLALKLRGQAATSIGINPEDPPRQWEAWNGQYWQPVLIQESDDSTRGFSFNEFGEQGRDIIQTADVVLHLPQRWPVTIFTAYQGRWLRCMYTTPKLRQNGYSSSPRIVSLSVRAIGGTVAANQCELIRDEILGTSDGKPGQKFQLLGAPILTRREDEYILVSPPGGLPQRWQEVNDFADSGPYDLHYTIDSITGLVQFGPLIREPGQLQQQTSERGFRQWGRGYREESSPSSSAYRLSPSSMDRQYGAVPPRGSVIRMVAYRTGGGRKGNVQKGTITVPKTAIPYVARVVNHTPARNGADAESLEDAVLRVPAMLRTRNRAVTPEDFEVLTRQAAEGAIARVRCLPAKSGSDAGTVRLLLVPQANTDAIARAEGIAPELFALSTPLQEQIQAYLDERRLLGVQVRLQAPEYVGVAVQAEVALEPAYNNPRAQEEILANLRVGLYRFINPS